MVIDKVREVEEATGNKRKHTTVNSETAEGEGKHTIVNPEMAEGENKKTTVEKHLTDKMIDSIETILGAIDNPVVQACSISFVSEQLRKLKVEAYMPKVVSMGPLHKGTTRELQHMEEIKLRCMLHLLHRSKEPLRNCYHDILTMDAVVRSCYNVDELKFNNYDLAKIMLLDGCFLLELLISGSKEYDSELKSSRDPPPSPGVEVIQREEVLSDLTMLENQIPLLIVYTLSDKLFPGKLTVHDINGLALSLLVGYPRGSKFDRVYDLSELVHRSFKIKEERESPPNSAGSDNVEGTQGNKDHSVTMPDDGDAEISHKEVKLKYCATRLQAAEISLKKLKFKRCATRLHAAGVTIKPPSTEANDTKQVQSSVPFDLKIRFEDGELEIPPLHITETTEDKWRNFIAWEVNRTVREKFLGVPEYEPSIECKFIWYALFFQSMICCVHDIQLLKNKNVIVVQKRKRDKKGNKKVMSNEDLLDFFSQLTEGVPDDLNYKNSSFSKLFKDLNSHRSGWWCGCCKQIMTIIWHTLRHLFTLSRYFCRKQLRLLKRYHFPTGWQSLAVLAVLLGLILTGLQTFAINSPGLRG